MHAKRTLALMLAATPTLALAHPGHEGTSGLLAGLAHPLLGVDHLVAAVLAGAWAAQRGGRTPIAVPAAFVLMLVAGIAAAPSLGLAAGRVEQLIAASLLVLGLGLAFPWRLPSFACVGLVGGFAFFHGVAHGSEQPAGSLLAYGAGLTITTAALLVAGIAAGNALKGTRSGALLALAGAAGAAGGLTLLAGG